MPATFIKTPFMSQHALDACDENAMLNAMLAFELALAEVQEHQIQRPILSCYEEALAAEPGLAGSIRYEVLGSHGILKTKLTGPGPEALQTCALKPMSNQRLLRTLGDGDHTVGFDLTVTFSPG